MKFLKFWFPVIAYSGIIFYISSLPNLKAPLERFSLDKVYHLGEYIVLGFLFTRALTHTKPTLSNKIALIVALSFVCFYGLTDEFHQSFVVGRASDLKDLIADTVGGFLGAWLFLKLSDQNEARKPASRGVRST